VRVEAAGDHVDPESFPAAVSSKLLASASGAAVQPQQLAAPSPRVVTTPRGRAAGCSKNAWKEQKEQAQQVKDFNDSGMRVRTLRSGKRYSFNPPGSDGKQRGAKMNAGGLVLPGEQAEDSFAGGPPGNDLFAACFGSSSSSSFVPPQPPGGKNNEKILVEKGEFEPAAGASASAGSSGLHLAAPPSLSLDLDLSLAKPSPHDKRMAKVLQEISFMSPARAGHGQARAKNKNLKINDPFRAFATPESMRKERKLADLKIQERVEITKMETIEEVLEEGGAGDLRGSPPGCTSAGDHDSQHLLSAKTVTAVYGTGRRGATTSGMRAPRSTTNTGVRGGGAKKKTGEDNLTFSDSVFPAAAKSSNKKSLLLGSALEKLPTPSKVGSSFRSWVKEENFDDDASPLEETGNAGAGNRAAFVVAGKEILVGSTDLGAKQEEVAVTDGEELPLPAANINSAIGGEADRASPLAPDGDDGKQLDTTSKAAAFLHIRIKELLEGCVYSAPAAGSVPGAEITAAKVAAQSDRLYCEAFREILEQRWGGTNTSTVPSLIVNHPVLVRMKTYTSYSVWDNPKLRKRLDAETLFETAHAIAVGEACRKRLEELAAGSGEEKMKAIIAEGERQWLVVMAPAGAGVGGGVDEDRWAADEEEKFSPCQQHDNSSSRCRRTVVFDESDNEFGGNVEDFAAPRSQLPRSSAFDRSTRLDVAAPLDKKAASTSSSSASTAGVSCFGGKKRTSSLANASQQHTPGNSAKMKRRRLHQLSNTPGKTAVGSGKNSGGPLARDSSVYQYSWSEWTCAQIVHKYRGLASNLKGKVAGTGRDLDHGLVCLGDLVHEMVGFCHFLQKASTVKTFVGAAAAAGALAIANEENKREIVDEATAGRGDSPVAGTTAADLDPTSTSEAKMNTDGVSSSSVISGERLPIVQLSEIVKDLLTSLLPQPHQQSAAAAATELLPLQKLVQKEVPAQLESIIFRNETISRALPYLAILNFMHAFEGARGKSLFPAVAFALVKRPAQVESFGAAGGEEEAAADLGKLLRNFARKAGSLDGYPKLVEWLDKLQENLPDHIFELVIPESTASSRSGSKTNTKTSSP